VKEPKLSAGCRVVDLERKCRPCGGLLDAEPWPEHARGCRCEALKEHRAVREKVSAMSMAGSVDPVTIQRIIAGEWTP
jgi:hypothetical protein